MHEHIPRESTTPPKAKKTSIANAPNVFATIMFLPNAATILNNAEAIWFMSTSRIYCLNSLHQTSKKPGELLAPQVSKFFMFSCLVYLYTFQRWDQNR